MASIEELNKNKEQLERKVDTEALINTVSHTVVVLSESFTHTGETYTEIDMNFAALTGRDFEEIDDELLGQNRFVPSPLASRAYQRVLAAKAAGVPADVIEALPARDYLAVVNAAKRFLQVTA